MMWPFTQEFISTEGEAPGRQQLILPEEIVAPPGASALCGGPTSSREVIGLYPGQCGPSESADLCQAMIKTSFKKKILHPGAIYCIYKHLFRVP